MTILPAYLFKGAAELARSALPNAPVIPDRPRRRTRLRFWRR